MVISDALSRLPNQRKNGDIHLDLRVEEISIRETDEGPNIDLINFGTQKQDALRKETSQDPCLRSLCQVITGWPGTCKELPTDLRPFWTYRDELGMADGVIFKGRQVLIPKPLQADILNQLHNGHQGIEKTRRLALYQLRDTSSATVAHLTAETLSLLGTPREIISDNGPPICRTTIPRYV
ncbi:hypothetical protein HOLleu_11953 [Holothuria leucospilota]|uniref:Integrase zinc-binding domain-containing protein n=1 Tax=Holothuria leucospilota TaxID=206669 RepID=A0A9Q1C9I5_HOLLE|nr:hypothetical protein HOLleu_11953 [Holothuria leucospilota]